ncbi:transglycosylase family protein [Actinoplanes sp. N902-109]|uniref:LysM peptidoglycan-binding domain-containing protein n=1 Tax=Actinoplanes sp. (strain N902-109) TaxID=649831 RepID=UPI0003295DB6|nr:transglycosylase family protein [Actinoplanes sp. N902-109]AGL17869.1 transglycosylase-like domain-containing protein [Actinoplanes sp. N902-109]
MGKHNIRKTSTSLRALGLMVAGAAGSAVLLGSGGAAQAKSSVNWDAVAQCESGGNWAINTGNGFYGGLQFTRSTWAAYGGTKYASTANKASRSQQIRIAEKVLDGQGIGAWPVCGKKAGSSKSYSGKNTSGASSSSKKSSAKKSTHSSHSTQSSKSRTTTHKSTKRATASVSAKATGRTYLVKSGDTLAKIAAAHGVKGGWRALHELNSGRISNPNLIFPGQRIAL